jgi:hypothetical protein
MLCVGADMQDRGAIYLEGASMEGMAVSPEDQIDTRVFD